MDLTDLLLLLNERRFAEIIASIFSKSDPVQNAFAGLGIVTALSFGLVVVLPAKIPRFIMIVLLSLSFGIVLGDVVLHGLAEMFGHHHHHSKAGFLHHFLTHMSFKKIWLPLKQLLPATLSVFPHENSSSSHHHSASPDAAWKLIFGVLLMYSLQSLVNILTMNGDSHHHHHHNHSHEADDKKESAPKQTGELYSFFVSSFSHALTDGIALASSFCIGQSAGFSTLTAMLFHETPHRIGEYALLLSKKLSKAKSLLLMLASASGGLVGVCLVAAINLGYAPGINNSNLADTQEAIAQVAVGGMLFMAFVTILPELFEQLSSASKLKSVGILAVQLVSIFVGTLAMASIEH